jgi:hypothetical protein
MTQLDLLAETVRARRTDPATSHKAAARVAEFQGGHVDRILATLKRHGPMTVDEIAKLSGLRSQQVNKRLPEMARATPALVVPTGHERPSDSGHSERVWCAL